MNLGEQQRMQGVLTIEVVDASGAIVETRRVPNLITTAGKRLMADILMGKRVAPSVWSIAVGTGMTSPTLGDVALGKQVAVATANDTDVVVGIKNNVVCATVKASLSPLSSSEPEQALVEAGILMTVGTEKNPTLFNRVRFSQVTRGQMMQLNLAWDISF